MRPVPDKKVPVSNILLVKKDEDMKDRPFFIVLFIVCCIGFGRAAPAWGEARTALIIGNGDYSRFPPLSRPVPEALSMKNTLERLGFEVLLLTNADREQMFETLYKFETTVREKGGIALFHYGGHGVQVDGKNYLIPTDADIPDERRARTRAVDVEEVMATLEASGSGTNIVILDACRNNPLPGEGRSAVRGLAAIERKPKNSIIVYAAEAGTVARDGVFTPTLIKHLGTRGARFTDVLREVRKEVYAITNGEQTPGSYDQSFEPIYLAGYKDGSSVAPGAAPSAGAVSGSTGPSDGPPISAEGAVCELFISTDPMGAEITVNGEKKGISPQLVTDIPLYSSVIIEARQDTLYGREEVSFKEKGVHELSVVLRQQTGNLFIKSSDPDVDVYLDGRRLGPLNTGFFKDLPVGTFPLELKANGAYWQKTVSIAADQSTRVEAEPAYFGRLRYRLPEGSRAEITGEQYRKVFRGRGTLDQVWEGTYSITVTGEIYNELSKTVSIRRGQSVSFSPDLSYTKAYVEGQREAAYTRFAEKLTELAGLLEQGRGIHEQDVRNAHDLSDEITKARYSFPDLVGRAEGIIVSMEKTYEKQLNEELYNRFAAELAEARDLLAEEYRITDGDIARVKTLASNINNARFRFPELIGRSAGLVKQAEKKQRLDGLTDRQAVLQGRLQKSIKARKGVVAGGFISLGLGVIGGGLTGLFMYLAEESYNEYMGATVTDSIIAFRQEFQTFDVLSYVSIGAGGVGLGLSALLFAAAPQPRKYREQLVDIRQKINELEGAE